MTSSSFLRFPTKLFRKAILPILAIVLIGSNIITGDLPSPVLVELFTSQGCSSCPSAEKVISTWGLSAFKKGEIIPLAFHVDYWNDLGWVDPYSSPEFTDRQRTYASVFRNASIYTPQMIVSGQSEFVGSNLRKAKVEVRRLRSLPTAAFIQIEPEWKDKDLLVVISAGSNASSGRFGKKTRVMLALFENDLHMSVRRGENAGKTHKGNFIVRRFMDLGAFKPSSSSMFKEEVLIPWDPSWKREGCGLAAFLQDRQTMKVYAAGKFFPLKI